MLSFLKEQLVHKDMKADTPQKEIFKKVQTLFTFFMRIHQWGGRNAYLGAISKLN